MSLSEAPCLVRLLGIRSRCSGRWLEDGKVAQLFGSGFRDCDFQPQLINDLVLRNCQCVFLRFVAASVLLIEVEDVGGEERRFLANVGEGFLYDFVNESPPIDWPDSGHCSKKGIGHCDVEPLGLFRTKDGMNNSITLRSLGF